MLWQPCVTAETANQLDIDFASLIEYKIQYQERRQSTERNTVAKQALLPYGIQVRKAVGRDNGFVWLPDRPIEQT